MTFLVIIGVILFGILSLYVGNILFRAGRFIRKAFLYEVRQYRASKTKRSIPKDTPCEYFNEYKKAC